MPSKPRPGVKGVYVEFPEGLHALLLQRAAEERRPFKTTLVMLLEEALGVTPKQYNGDSADVPEPSSGKKKPARKKK